ncbi:MAG: RNA polymerase sigma factor [Anaerolineaceae bacterium]|nr:RNA polymerase sigma factor [Anaerolineaceae bacterium]
MNNSHEIALARAAQKGDRDAMGELFDHYLPKVYARVCTLVPQTDTEDVTQEIFMSLVRSIQSFRGDSSFSTWLYNIVKRRVADYYRKFYRQVSQVPIEDHEFISNVGNTRNIEEMLVLKEVLSMLAGGQREVILLRLVDGLPFSEIAAHLGLELGAAKVRFYRAIKACKKLAQDQMQAI